MCQRTLNAEADTQVETEGGPEDRFPGILSDPTASDGGPTNSGTQGDFNSIVRLRRQEGWSHIATSEQSKPSNHQDGFLSSRGHQPASDLRMLLLMAGDVERNPGPGTCVACPAPVRRNQPPAKCSECGEERHLKCLGVSWSMQKNIKKDTHIEQGRVQWYNWTCKICSGQTREEDTVREVRNRGIESGEEVEETSEAGVSENNSGGAGVESNEAEHTDGWMDGPP